MDASSPPFVIDIRLRTIGELFASLDPSPLVERDLDDAVEEFIVDSVTDAPRQQAIGLVVHLAEPAPETDARSIETSVRNYFAFMAGREARRVKRLWRDGRQALLVGLAFLVVCLGLSQAAAAIGQPAGAILREGLLIIGWVANWRPIEIFLYDWRPIRRRKRVYERLSQLTVTVRTP
ncbi:MAG: hypothetical protein AB7P23_11395 [Amphiplicatus sp.]